MSAAAFARPSRGDLRVAVRRAAAGERAARATAAEAGSPGWRITPLRAADLDAVRSLDALAFPGNSWQKGGYPAALGRREAYVLRLPDGTVASVHVVREGDDGTMGLEKLAVRPDLHGRGLGRWFFRWAVLYARERGSRRAVLQVREDNARAIGIYLAAGLRVTRRMENHYPTGCSTALEMEIVLASAPAAAGAA